MKIEVNLNKKYFFAFALIFIFITLGIFAYAYNNPAVGGNPAVFGHSADELKGVCLTNGSGCPASSSSSNIVGTQIYDKPGTYSVYVPSGVSSIKVQVVGGGGGGGPAYYQSIYSSSGSGGGGGAYAQKTALSVSAGYVGNVTVGGGGSMAYCTSGGTIAKNIVRSRNGNESSFSDKNGVKIARARGGQGGDAYPWTWAGTYEESIGLGGVADIGDVLVDGTNGQSTGGTATQALAGINPNFYLSGKGGDGSVTGTCDQPGRPGVVFITMYG